MTRPHAAAITETKLLGGRVTTFQPATGYRTAIDAVLLAAAVPAGKRAGEHALELGTGVGAAAFCLAARVGDITVTGLERATELVALARMGVRANGFEGRVEIVTGDVLAPPEAVSARTFDHVFLNPPYVLAGTSNPSPDPLKAAATVEGAAKLADWLGCAAGACKPGGSVTVIHLFERLDELTDGLAARGLGALEVLALLPKAGGRAKRVIVRARAHDGPGAITTHPPLVLHVADGGFTEAAERLLRHAESLL